MDAVAVAMDPVARDVAAMDAVAVAMDVLAMNAAAMAVTAAMVAAAATAEMDAVDAVVVVMAVDVVGAALPPLPKHVVRLEATTYPPTKTSSSTPAIATTATGWRTSGSTSMPFLQGQQVPLASPHHLPVLLASPCHQFHAWLIGPA